MNLWTDSEWKWAPEPESKPEIERKHLHHRDMTNLLNYTTNLNWLSHTLSKSVSVQFYYNKWISGLIPNGNELLNPNQNPKLKENICIIEIWPINGIIPLIRIDSHILFPWVESVQFYYNKWISGLIPNGNELLNPNQNPKLKENICIIEIWPIKWNKPLIRIDSHILFPWV